MESRGARGVDGIFASCSPPSTPLAVRRLAARVPQVHPRRLRPERDLPARPRMGMGSADTAASASEDGRRSRRTSGAAGDAPSARTTRAPAARQPRSSPSRAHRAREAHHGEHGERARGHRGDAAARRLTSYLLPAGDDGVASAAASPASIPGLRREGSPAFPAGSAFPVESAHSCASLRSSGGAPWSPAASCSGAGAPSPAAASRRAEAPPPAAASRAFAGAAAARAPVDAM